MIEIIKNNSNTLIIIMIFICIIGIILMFLPLFLKKKNNKEVKFLEINDKEIKKIDTNLDKEELEKEVFSLYKKTEVAKSKFDYNTLKELLTENFYIEEEKKLKELKNNKQKIVATNIKLQDLKILSIQKKEELEIINAYLHVSQYDYVTDSKKKIVRGTDESEYQIEYKITVEKNKDNLYKIKDKECIGKWIKNK